MQQQSNEFGLATGAGLRVDGLELIAKRAEAYSTHLSDLLGFVAAGNSRRDRGLRSSEAKSNRASRKRILS